jgi:hypothetical protein
MKALALDWEYADLTPAVFSCAEVAGEDPEAAADRRKLCAGLGATTEQGEGGGPRIVLLKEGALNAYEYHDRVDREEQVLAFVEASFRSVVHELDGPDLIAHAIEEKQTWFVDFYAPWCHHCRDVWPEWNGAAHSDDLPHSVHFGKVTEI